MSQNETVERKYSDYVPKEINLQCIRCDKTLDDAGMGMANANRFPCVSGGVVFRASGQYGSKVLDCGVGIPRGFEPEIQIILCDECVTEQGHRINMWTTPRPVLEISANYGGDTRERLVEWSDYTTYNAMMEACKIADPHTGYLPLGIAADLEEAEKKGDTEEAEKIRNLLKREISSETKKWLEEQNKKTPEELEAEYAAERLGSARLREIHNEEKARLMKLYGPKE